MERKSSIHIEKGNLGYCFHNTRQKPTANSIFKDEKIEFDNDAIKAIEIYKNELKKREIAYTKRTGKKLHKNTITHLSAIVNLDARHTLEDVKKIAKHFEQTLGTKVFQIAVHRDEGYVDEETGEKHINYHGHIEMLGLDDQGNSIRRKLTKSYLINLQSKVAEILGMQRGINYTKERKKRPKRLDTYEYKEYAKRKARELKSVLKENKQLKKENEELKLTKKDLLKEISELRKKMIEFNQNREQKEFTQEDYRYLSTLKKELNTNNLKEIYIKLREFDKSVKERMSKFREYKEYLEKELKEKNAKIEELKKLVYSDKYKKKLDNNEIRQATYAEVAERFKTKYEELEKEYNELIDDYNELVDKVDVLEEENKRLREEIELLKQQLMQNYRAEVYCVTCNRVKPFDPYIITRLKAKNLIEEYKRNDEGKMIIKTKEFELEEIKEEEIKKKEGFKIKKEKGQLTEEEIEKALLIILQVKGWDINDIKANGSKDFVEKANKVIEKLKVERIVEENFENLRWSLSEQFYRYCEKNNPEYDNFNEFFKKWIVEQVLKGNIDLNDYINTQTLKTGFKFKR